MSSAGQVALLRVACEVVSALVPLSSATEMRNIGLFLLLHGSIVEACLPVQLSWCLEGAEAAPGYEAPTQEHTVNQSLCYGTMAAIAPPKERISNSEVDRAHALPGLSWSRIVTHDHYHLLSRPPAHRLWCVVTTQFERPFRTPSGISGCRMFDPQHGASASPSVFISVSPNPLPLLPRPPPFPLPLPPPLPLPVTGAGSLRSGRGTRGRPAACAGGWEVGPPPLTCGVIHLCEPQAFLPGRTSPFIAARPLRVAALG